MRARYGFKNFFQDRGGDSRLDPFFRDGFKPPYFADGRPSSWFGPEPARTFDRETALAVIAHPAAAGFRDGFADRIGMRFRNKNNYFIKALHKEILPLRIDERDE